MRGETTQPELPTLEPGLTLLEVDERSTGALHSLVLDHLLLESGNAVWVDAHGHGTTQPLARIAPSLRLLERIAIARAFTPWQHYSLLRALSNECTTETNLLVLPAVDYFYCSGDCSDREGERLFTAGCSLITDLAATAEVPVVVTRTADDDFTAPLTEFVETDIQCELTTLDPDSRVKTLRRWCIRLRTAPFRRRSRTGSACSAPGIQHSRRRQPRRRARMRRTNRTYRDLVQAMELRWTDYRRVLRRDDQAAFDRLFEHVRTHADAGGVQNHPSIEVTVLLLIVLKLQLHTDDLDDRLTYLETDLNTEE